MYIRHIRVFLSSPGDVQAERQAALRVLRRLRDDPLLRDQVSLQVVAWNEPGAGTPLLATMTPQEAINRGMRLPCECELVTVIMSGRLGTPLPETMLKPDGSRYRSGTEWEYLNAIEGFERCGRPQVVVYRRIGLGPPPDAGAGAGADGDGEAADQRRQVEAFFAEFRDADGSFRRGYNEYPTPEEFEQRYENDLKVLLRHLIEDSKGLAPPGHEPGPVPVPRPGPDTPRGPIHLPGRPDLPFIGREWEWGRVRRIFAEQPGRVVTIVGAGGLGKTRLACELAEDLAGLYSGGCYFVNLSDQETRDGIAIQLADALGERLATIGDPSELIAGRLKYRPPTLFILDNFEQLIAHADATVGLWHRAAPGAGWLITSRAVLGLDDETCFPLGPLPLPEQESEPIGPDGLARAAANPAVCLFAERARRRRPDFALDESNAAAVVRICREMDGLPLPILLVAGRINEFTAEELAGELTDRFSLASSSRETLWETIDWSYQLLPDEEREAFLQVCIFRDGFQREAFREVVRLPGVNGPGPARPRIDRLLGRLCDYSLINTTSQQGRTRFQLYRSVQDFGRRMWGGDPDRPEPPEPPAELARRWVAHYADYAERWSARLPTPEGVAALEALVQERENILESHRWVLEHGATAEAARLMLAFAPALTIRGPWQGRVERLAETCRGLDGDPGHQPVRVRLLARLAEACWAVGDWDQARVHAQQAVDEASTLNDTEAYAQALTALGWFECELQLRHTPLVHLNRSRRLCRARGDRHQEAINLWLMGRYYVYRCRYEWASSVLERAIALLRQVGDLPQLARAVNMQGIVLWHRGRPAPALERFEEAERINRQLGDIRWVGGHLTNQGLALIDLDRIDEALRCFDAAEPLHRSQGNRAWWAVNQGGRGHALMSRGDPRGLDLLCEARDVSRQVNSREDVALCQGCLGLGLLRLGRHREAAAALEEAIRIQREIQMRSNRRHWANLVHYAEALLGLGLGLGDDPRVPGVVAEANRLGTRLGLGPDETVRTLRESWAALQNLNRRLGLPPLESQRCS
jgi:predicted ATPase